MLLSIWGTARLHVLIVSRVKVATLYLEIRVAPLALIWWHASLTLRLARDGRNYAPFRFYRVHTRVHTQRVLHADYSANVTVMCSENRRKVGKIS